MIILACLIFATAMTTALIVDIFTGSHHTGVRLGYKFQGVLEFLFVEFDVSTSSVA